MKRFLKMYMVEQKLALRSGDMLIFGVGMPIGILVLIGAIAGEKLAGDTGLTYLGSAFASLIAVGICAAGFMGIPLTIADYRDKKILKHFFVTPCSPVLILATTITCGMVTAMLSAVCVSIVAMVAFGYRMQGNLLLFVGSWFLTLISMFSIGMMLASVCRTVKTANAVTSLVYFPMLFLSGATIPFELFPAGLQRFASFLPLTQGIRLMKAVSMGVAVENIKGIVILLLVIAVVCGMISIKTFQWE